MNTMSEAVSDKTADNEADNGTDGVADDVEVSFVFPTRNRREIVRRLLTYLRTLPGPKHEVIVIDDASSDGTWAMIRRDFPEVRGFRNETQSAQEQLQSAVEMARGRFVFELDDDSWPAEDTLQKVVAHFEARGSALGLVALPIHDAKTGRLGYTSYFPKLSPGERYAPTYGYRGPGVVFRRDALREVPISPPGYFSGGFETVTVIELRRRGWEADFLADAPVYHLWVGRPRTIRPDTAFYPLRNDLVTFRRYYRGWQRSEMMIGRLLVGLVHLSAAGRPQDFPRAVREANRMFAERGVSAVSQETRRLAYPCFDGVTLKTLFSETNLRRVAWKLGFISIDQTC